MSFHNLGHEFGGLPVVPVQDALTYAEQATGAAEGRRAGPRRLPAPDRAAWKLEVGGRGFGEDLAPHFESFLDTVDTTRVTALLVGAWGDIGVSADVPVALLCEAADRLPCLRHLYLGDMTADECEISWIQQGDLTPLLSAFPALETLVAKGSNAVLDPVHHTALRHLEFIGSGLSGRLPHSLAAAEFPELRTLDVWFGPEDYGCTATPDDADALLRRGGLPALTRLALKNCEFADDLAATLAGAPIVGQLRELDLSLGTFGDEGAEALLAGQPLAHLVRLNLEHNFLTDTAAERLRASLTGVEVITSDRNPAGQWGRYVAVGE